MSEIGDLECAVCLQEYTETGEFVPRILPCHDIDCERCIKRLLREACTLITLQGEGCALKCPVCRRQFYADKGFKTFP